MGCWTRIGVIAIGFVGTGLIGSAQTPISATPNAVSSPSPTPAATDGAREGEVLVFRSAGQPERRLQVLRVSSIPNGPTLVDVKDLESDAQYTLPAQALTAAKRIGTALPTPAATPPTSFATNTVTRTPVEPPKVPTPVTNTVARTPVAPPPPVSKAASYTASMNTPPVNEYRTTYPYSVAPAAMAQSRVPTPTPIPASAVANSTHSHAVPPLAMPPKRWTSTAVAPTPITTPTMPVPASPAPAPNTVAAMPVTTPPTAPTPNPMTPEPTPTATTTTLANKLPESNPSPTATASSTGMPQSALPAAYQRHPIAPQTTSSNNGWPQMASGTVRPWPQFGQPVVTPTVAAGSPTPPKEETPAVASAPPVRSHPMPAWQDTAVSRTPAPSVFDTKEETPLMRPSVLAKLAATKPPEPPAPEKPVLAMAVPTQPLTPVALETPAPTPSKPIPEQVSPPVPMVATIATPRVPMAVTIAAPSVPMAVTIAAPTPVNPTTTAAHWQAATANAGIQTVSLSQPTRADRWVAAPPTTRMVAEIQPWVNDLANALRPSVRETAATALAEGRYGSRPEVKSALATAAMTDPAATVRVHCIRLLSALGYHETEYVSYLRAVGYSGEPEVQSAAIAALAKLSPR